MSTLDAGTADPHSPGATASRKEGSTRHGTVARSLVVVARCRPALWTPVFLSERRWPGGQIGCQQHELSTKRETALRRRLQPTRSALNPCRPVCTQLESGGSAREVSELGEALAARGDAKQNGCSEERMTRCSAEREGGKRSPNSPLRAQTTSGVRTSTEALFCVVSGVALCACLRRHGRVGVHACAPRLRSLGHPMSPQRQQNWRSGTQPACTFHDCLVELLHLQQAQTARVVLSNGVASVQRQTG